MNTPAIVTPDDMPQRKGWLAQAGDLLIVLVVTLIAPIILREETKHNRRHTMRMKTALTLLAVLLVGIAWLALPRGKVETVTGAAATHVQLPGSANLVIIEHQGGNLCYYGVNMSTGQWATAYTATNGIPISNSLHRIEGRRVHGLSFQGPTATTSTIHWAAF